MEMQILNPKTDEVQLDPDKFDDMEDLTGKRILKGDGFSYTCVSKDPHGFWTIHQTNGGAIAEELKGQFTSFSEVERTVAGYHNKLKLWAAQDAQKKAEAKAAEDNKRKLYAEMKKQNDVKVAELNAVK